MKKYISLIFFCITLSVISYAQSSDDKEKAYDLALQAVKIMDEGKFEESIDLLRKAMELDSTNLVYLYEIGYALYSQKKYEEAIQELKKTIDHKDVTPQHFQLIGNSYDYLKQPDKALEVYKKGLEKFPNSGKLYLEQGILEYSRENYDEAVSYWEKGVEVEPTFSSNYYWLGKIFSYTDERIWSVLYAEMFINLERNSARTVEMSEILFNTYQDAIQIGSDSTGSVHFSKVMMINADEKEMKIPFQMNFGMMMTLSMAVNLSEKDTIISISYLNNLRQDFVENWFNEKNEKEHPNLIFDFHKILKDKGYFEAYNYWILMKGNESEFDKWYESNEEKFTEFVNWFSDNALEVTKVNYFSRNKY